MKTTSLRSVGDVDASAWDALIGPDNPFVEHRFLHTLETSRSVGKGTGWLPRPVVVTDGNDVVGVAPAYLRHDSYGEFIFDWGWAQAAQRAGIAYYPKVTVAVPFTPATGPRLLIAPGADADAVRDALVKGVLALAQSEGASSAHVLFCRDEEANALTSRGLMRRASMQFHWRNGGWSNFDAFLESLKHDERKQLRRERRRVAEAGVRVELRMARDVPSSLIPALFQLYTSTSDRKWGRPYLTEAFFHALPQVLGDRALFGLAWRDDALVAMTLSFEKGAHIYGRHWGCSADIPGLHFELCYCALIERALAQRSTLFEAGAQGEHKLKRGFLPVITHSAHTLFHPGLKDAVARFLREELRGMHAEQEELLTHTPFRDGAAPDRALVAGVDDL